MARAATPVKPDPTLTEGTPALTAKGLQEETLRAMIEAGAVREVLISRQDDKWGLAIRLGGAGSRWLPVRSRREALRTWASLTAVGRFAEALGIKGFAVEL